MKQHYLFTLLIVAVSYFSQAQSLTLDEDTKKQSIVEVVTVKVPKATLLSRAKKWATTNKLTPVAKHEASDYVGKGILTLVYPSNTPGKTDIGEISYTVTISCKEGKYRYEFTDFVHAGTKGKGSGGEFERKEPACQKTMLTMASWAKIHADTEAQIKELIEKLKNDMAGVVPKAPKKKDW